MTGPRNSLVSTINTLLDSIETDIQRDALIDEDWAEIRRLLSLIEGIENINIPEQRTPVLRRTSRQIIEILGRIKKGSLRQELVREVRRSAEQLERMTCLVSLYLTLDRVIETDYMVRDLRERVLTGIKKYDDPESCEFSELVNEAIEGLVDYAVHRGIELRKDDHSKNVYVWAARRDIVRAMNNLLHNAIKYSWSRDPNVKPWIEIRSYAKESHVYVDIEDYGVPIPQDEIDRDLVFQLGYRGRLSSQRGRIGTGIGLGDARDVARRDGGDVTITSRPASHYFLPADLLNHSPYKNSNPILTNL